MTVRIKRLELHGFKSFPRSTVFEFDTGITAVIGPNGSGKSNIADGMRWVLGEQSYSNLRGRRAEDVIFSGSDSRAAVGMAEVTLTLDNTSGELPIEFQEVSITRRAYRSGENQYLINGARVRLKDVNHITAKLGQSHTVIGQGLVDAALSQRPEERRGLFEHAAGITGLRMKYAATARHLTETTTNSTRLEDLLNELEPRLKTLERQAKQAREYADVQQSLRETTLRYYSSLWREHQARLRDLHEQVSVSDKALESADSGLEAARADIQQQSSELEALQERSESLDQRLSSKRSHVRELEHRIELNRQRKESLAAEVERYSQRREALMSESGQIHADLNERRAEHDSIQQQLTELEARLIRERQQRDGLDQQINQAIARRDELDTERDALRQQLYRAQADQEYRRQQQNDLQSRTDSISTRREELEAQIAGIQRSIEHETATHASLKQQADARAAEIVAIEAELQRHREHQKQLRQKLGKLDTDRASRSARLDALQRLQESGEGLHRGVQTVLDATRSGTLDGIIGTLASQISVPEQLETAIEAALGGHLQDIIVQRWADAEAAIAHLKQQNAGRATFQPLDTQRRSGNQSRPSLKGDSGVQGIAVDLIEFGSEMEPVLEGLIGRTVITDDLASTRQILGKLRTGWTVVTLEGEVSRSGGSVTGGSRIRQSGTLGRERELRDLPGDLERIDQQRVRLQAEIDQAARDSADAEDRLESARNELRRIEGELDSSAREQHSREQQLSQSRADLENLESETKTASSESERLAAEIAEIAGQNESDTSRLAELDQKREETVAQLEQLQSSADDADLRQLENEHSRLGERLQSVNQQLKSAQDRQARLQEEIAAADAERQASDDSISNLVAELAELEQQVESDQKELVEISTNQEPLAAQRSALQAKLSELQSTQRELQNRQRELERQRDSQRFDIERETAQGAHLVERVTDILEIEDPVPLLNEQPVELDLDHQKLETDLHRLRQRSRRIGAFGEDTIAQYEQEQERYTFLRGQLDDVQSGAEALQSMLRDLDRAMSEEFDRTFGQVAQAFQLTFQRLFGGGSAQLMRNDEEDSTGIDIVAQPPGKKLQSLALLSGGERALTAVALLFAIQRVNPSPFCLLDEVDAALDEANVVRFRDELRDLSVNTQFVVVTHNRSTIEGADVLYGITMGTDAVSRVVSLKLPEEAPVPAG
jgi:chromosome segregation protein